MAGSRRPLRALLAGGTALVVTLALLELGAMLLVKQGAIEAPPPHRGKTGFWWHAHPAWGAWHHPNREGPHNGACYRTTYRTNSVGARDVERPRHATGPRVVVLGDSFLEGWGIGAESRFSNRLETLSELPHLNFAMASFGTYQQLLVYRELALEFDHDAVITSFLPQNDFGDIDIEVGRQLTDQEYAYRPYLVGDPPDLERFDLREPALMKTLRLHSYAFNAARTALRVQRTRGSGPRMSWFYDFNDRQVALLEAILERLVTAAGDRPVVLVLIPSEADLTAYRREGADPLSQRLAAPLARLGITLVNLLPAMAEATTRDEAYFFPCDFHWSAYGNRVAADLTYAALDRALYTPLREGE